MKLLCDLALLVAGGLATSYAEYHFKYNLFDYLYELTHGVEAAIAKDEAKLSLLKAKLSKV